MPVPWHPVPPTLPPLRLYRHLLRESSYLPPAFRTTVALTIRTQFRRNRSPGPLAKPRLSRALATLRTLRSANSGCKKAMEQLILKGFARTGRRRRELVAQIVKPQGPNNSQALEALLDSKAADDHQPCSVTDETGAGAVSRKAKKHKNDFFKKWDRPKLSQFLRSQKQQQGITKQTTSWPAAEVKTLNQDQYVPKLNIWGKPPAECVVRAKRACWWRQNADKIMPPVGQGEWDLLGRLSSGAQAQGEWAVPERRRPAKAIAQDDKKDGLCESGWEAYAVKPAAVIESEKGLFHQRRSGQIDTGPHACRERSRVISSRWFRRAYNRTWQLTPTVYQDPNTLKYSFKWGAALSRLPAATKIQHEVFEGLDDSGHQAEKGQAEKGLAKKVLAS